MKIKVDVITGFLGSGKTSFINSILEEEESKEQIIVIIQDEFGCCEINYDSYNKNKIIVVKNGKNQDINHSYIIEIINEYSPNMIFIEANGMKDSTKIINIFNNKDLKKLCKVNDIINIIDASNFNIYFRNMKNIVTPNIFNSETIILNNADKLEKKDLLKLQKEIFNINETADITKRVNIINEDGLKENIYLDIKKSNFLFFNTSLCLGLLIFAFILIAVITTLNVKVPSIYFDKFKRFYDIFISILIQGFPFILIGSFISSIIQICIPSDTFIKIFSKNIFLSCIISAFAGLLFPICDCGTIPVVRGLIKKKVPIAAGITFMLAAPIVNPIAIIATIYAFPGMLSVVVYRVLAGLLISILVGLIMQFTTKSNEDILKADSDLIECNCDFCNDTAKYSKSKISKTKSIFIHAGDEFFNIGKFMIIGTFLSSIFQSMNFLSSNNTFQNNSAISLIIMILLSFLLSVCSTSDAFVAKGFFKLFPLNSILGFLVVGPMLDIKNTIMLFGTFKNKFVLKLIFFIIVVSFGVLINCKLS